MAANKYRTTGHDMMPSPPKAKPEDKPGVVPKHRIQIIDHLGRARGTVSHKATAAGVSRFLNGHGSVLTKYKGRQVWREVHPHGGSNAGK